MPEILQGKCQTTNVGLCSSRRFLPELPERLTRAGGNEISGYKKWKYNGSPRLTERLKKCRGFGTPVSHILARQRGKPTSRICGKSVSVTKSSTPCGLGVSPKPNEDPPTGGGREFPQKTCRGCFCCSSVMNCKLLFKITSLKIPRHHLPTQPTCC